MLPDDCICYLINLDRSRERLAVMASRLAAAGIAFERVPAVDGATLDDAALAGHSPGNRYYKPLRRGEVGCYLSHLEVMRRFVASGKPYALVLEDDVVLADGFAALVVTAIAQRARTVDPLLAWDVLKLAARRRRYIDLGPLDAGHRLVEYGPSVPATTAAALWTQAGARRWLQAYPGVMRPVDCDLQHPWESGLEILSVHPAPTHAGTETTMDSRDHATRNPWLKLRYEARRLLPKWRHFVRRYGAAFTLRWLWRGQLAHRAGASR